MIPAIKTLSTEIYNQLPALKLDKPENIIAKAQKIALPALAIIAIQQANTAHAFFELACVTCVAAGGSFACLPVCIAAGVTIIINLH